jgi:hypothetical protein
VRGERVICPDISYRLFMAHREAAAYGVSPVCLPITKLPVCGEAIVTSGCRNRDKADTKNSPLHSMVYVYHGILSMGARP